MVSYFIIATILFVIAVIFGAISMKDKGFRILGLFVLLIGVFGMIWSVSGLRTFATEDLSEFAARKQTIATGHFVSLDNENMTFVPTTLRKRTETISIPTHIANRIEQTQERYPEIDFSDSFTTITAQNGEIKEIAITLEGRRPNLSRRPIDGVESPRNSFPWWWVCLAGIVISVAAYFVFVIPTKPAHVGAMMVSSVIIFFLISSAIILNPEIMNSFIKRAITEEFVSGTRYVAHTRQGEQLNLMVSAPETRENYQRRLRIPTSAAYILELESGDDDDSIDVHGKDANAATMFVFS